MDTDLQVKEGPKIEEGPSPEDVIEEPVVEDQIEEPTVESETDHLREAVDNFELAAMAFEARYEYPEVITWLKTKMTPEEQGEFLVEGKGKLDRSPGKNWVERRGGLPNYIERIAVHLNNKGMSIGHAIATAVNAAKKMCATGDLNWPGLQNVNPGSRAEACAAVAQWEAMKAG